MIEAGFCQLDITPPMGILMGGHPGTKHSEGVLDNLFCRAMVIKTSETTIAFISADLLFLDDTTVSSARQEISQISGIAPELIFLNATHTHSGPLTTDVFGVSAEREYVSGLPEVFAKACCEALKNSREVRIGFDRISVPGIAFNARFIMKDGVVETHPQKGSKGVIAAEGPVDDELLIMYISDEQGELLGALVNFSNHPQFLARRSRDISADFPGRIEKYIRGELSNSAVILFGNGACGNICPVNALDTEKIELGELWMDRVGKVLADRCISLLKKVDYQKETTIKTATRLVKIAIREISEDKVAEAKRFLKENKDKDIKEVELSDYGTESDVCDKLSIQQFLQTSFWKKQEYEDLLALVKEKSQSPFEEIEISVIAIGENVVVMVPVELFVELGLDIKKNSPFKNTMIIELANGYSGYVPTKKAFSRSGGYETLTLRSSKLVSGAGEIIVAKVAEMMDGLL